MTTTKQTPHTNTEPPDQRSALRIWLSRVLYVMYTLVISLVLLEVLLRTTHLFGAKMLWSQSDPVLGRRNIPGRAYYWYQENSHPITGRINKYGWRDKDWSLAKPPGTYRIAAIGDSFVEAMQIESDRTFEALASKRLSENLKRPVEMMNFGRQGFAQGEEYLVLQHDIIKFDPDMVILFFFPENDVSEASPEAGRRELRPFYQLSKEDHLVLDTSFNKTKKYRMRSLMHQVTTRSALAAMLRERIGAMSAKVTPTKGEKTAPAFEFSKAANGLAATLTLCTQHPEPRYARNYRVNKALIGAMADYCRARRIRFMLVCIDTGGYVPLVENAWKKIDPTFDVNFFEDDLARYSRVHGIEYLGLQRLFRDRYEHTGTALHWWPLAHWGHWNYDGHREVADALARRLEPEIRGK